MGHPAAPNSTAAAVTAKAISDTDAEFLSATAGRLGFSIYNDADQILYVKYGGAATTTSFTIQIAAEGYYEDPWRYEGVVHGIWAAAGIGNALVTELT